MKHIHSVVFSSLLLLNFVFAQQASKAFSFQEDGFIDDDSNKEWAFLTSPEAIPQMNALTVCTWFKLHFNRLHNQLWSYCAMKGNTTLLCSGLEILSVLESRAIVATISNAVVRANISQTFRSHQWNLICMIMSKNQSAQIQLILNGVKIAHEMFELGPKELFEWPENGAFILGQDQDELRGGYESTQSFSGAISGIDIWNQELQPDKVKAIADCQEVAKGNILNWQESNWEISGEVKTMEVKPEDFCIVQPNTSYIMIPQLQSRRISRLICEKLGGSLPLPRNQAENSLMLSQTVDFQETCDLQDQSGKITWLNLIPDGSGKWLDRKTQMPPVFTNWRDGGKSKQTEDNCAYMVAGKPGIDGKWSSTTCSDQSPRSLCPLCIFESAKIRFTLRGLCPDSRHDRVYYLEKSATLGSMPYFKGISSSVITFNESLSTWILTHLRFNSPGYVLSESLDNMPVGRKQWVLNDKSCGGNKTILLTLTKCSKDEFTCNDGSCEPIDARCDLKPDCADHSDEQDCRKVSLDEINYESDQAPRFADENGSVVKDEPLPVFLNVELLAFDEISTVKMMFSVIMELNITWKDRRLDYLHLREDPYQNTVNPKYRKTVWIPEIGLSNAKTGRLEKDENSALLVSKKHAQGGFDPSRAVEDAVYKGHQNDLLFIRRYQAEYHCVFDLRLFPFDEQECSMIFRMRSATKKLVQLKPGDLIYDGPKVMVEFVLENLSFHDTNGNGTRSELIIHFKLARQYIYHISQSFFQSFLLGFLSYLTFFIDVQDFNERFIGALTALLVLASLLSSMTENLPKTSYFKIIDIWLLFFLITNSLVIAIHIIIDKLHKKEGSPNDSRKFSRSGLFSRRRRDSQPLAITADDVYAKQKMFIRVNSKVDNIIIEEPERIIEKPKDPWINTRKVNYIFRVALPLIFLIFVLFLSLSITFRVGVARAL